MKLHLKEDIKITNIDKKLHLLIHPDSGNWILIEAEKDRILNLKNNLENIYRYILHDKNKADLLIKDLISLNFIKEKKNKNKENKLKVKSYLNNDYVMAILNITYDCNMKCSYCYSNGGTDHSYMKRDTLIKIIKFLADNYKKIQLVFHGGEPLLYFNLISFTIEYIKKESLLDRFDRLGVQSNGTLLKKSYFDYFKNNKISLGISIDGKEKEHNAIRKFRNNRGSFSNVMKGLSLFHKYNPDQFIGVILTLSKKNFYNIDEILNFFIINKIFKININPFFPGGRGVKVKNELQLNSVQMAKAYKTVINKIISHNKKLLEANKNYKEIMREDTSINLFRNLISNQRPHMCFRSPCGAGNSIISFDPNGNIYPCDNLTGVREFFIGNVHSNKINSIYANSKIRNYLLRRTANALEGCSNCEWKTMCGGGCPYQVFSDYGTIYKKDNIRCGFIKIILPYILFLYHRKKLNLAYLGDRHIIRKKFSSPQDA